MTTTGNSGAATYSGGTLNIPQYQGAITLTTNYTSGFAAFNGTTLNVPHYQGALTLTTTGTSGAATLSGTTLNIPQYGGGSSGTFGQSASTGASIAATNLISSVPSNPGMYSLSWTISLTAAGVGCTGSTSVVFQDVFTDPNASTSNTVTIATSTLASSGNGTPGYIADGVVTITAKTATAIQYQTTYTEGAGCTTAPTYQISYTITQLH